LVEALLALPLLSTPAVRQVLPEESDYSNDDQPGDDERGAEEEDSGVRPRLQQAARPRLSLFRPRFGLALGYLKLHGVNSVDDSAMADLLRT
jgi:hypothetical protein